MHPTQREDDRDEQRYRQQQRQVLHAGNGQQLEYGFLHQPVRSGPGEHPHELIADQDQHEHDRHAHERARDLSYYITVDDPGHEAAAPTFAWSRLIR